jgi:myo-inositol-1(or 4)-monophosphatase
MKPLLNDLESLAREAGKILRAGYPQHNHVELKGEIDLVTEIDRQSESFLLGAIGDKFPTHRVISEETGGREGSDEHVWYIDPLDGTTNFAHGLPIFSVSIAYGETGAPTLGVVYNPISDEMFSGEKGEGAWLNGSPIKASSTAKLSHSLLVTGFPYDRFENPDNNLSHFNNFALQVQGIRRLGSAALDLCYVACGRVDGYWEVRLEPWDLAAGTLIAREAGAVVSKIDGNPDMLAAPYSVMAANPGLYKEMLKVIEEREY